MKKITLIIFYGFCLTNVGLAQDMTVGLRIGSNLSILKGDYGNGRENTNYSTIDASHISYGLYFNYEINNILSTQFEINSRTKRMYYTSEGLIGADWDGKSNFNYLEIPILAKYRIGNRFKGFINTGPVLNILVSGGNYDYYTWSSHAGGIRNEYNRNIKSDFNSVTIGILGGLGFEWNIFTDFVLLVEARITYDLSNTTKTNNYTDPNTSEQWYFNDTHFFVFSTDIGIAYKLGKRKKKPSIMCEAPFSAQAFAVNIR